MKEKTAFDKYNHINRPIFDKVEEGARVLEIGCWIGALGGELIKQKKCKVDGLDANAEALKKARGRGYERLYCQDLNLLDTLRIEDKRYDYIIFGDVLEHLLYPEEVICFFLKYLSRDGKMLISLPNVAFILYRLKLLAGSFDYEELGVMDKTHVRFYTLSSMKKLFERVGLKVESVESYNNVGSRYFVLQVLKNILPRLFTLQFVFMLSPLSIQKPVESAEKVVVTGGNQANY